MGGKHTKEMHELLTKSTSANIIEYREDSDKEGCMNIKMGEKRNTRRWQVEDPRQLQAGFKRRGPWQDLSLQHYYERSRAQNKRSNFLGIAVRDGSLAKRSNEEQIRIYHPMCMINANGQSFCINDNVQPEFYQGVRDLGLVYDSDSLPCLTSEHECRFHNVEVEKPMMRQKNQTTKTILESHKF
jgi:hypothetical protein